MIKKILLIVFCICLVFTIPAIAGGHHGGHGTDCNDGGDDGGDTDTGGGNDNGGGSSNNGGSSGGIGFDGGPGDIASQDRDDPCDTYKEFINNHCTFRGFRTVPYIPAE